VGRPSQKPLVEYKGFLYQAAGWKTARRVVAKVEQIPALFPSSDNLSRDNGRSGYLTGKNSTQGGDL
jgi:hypothetical protein